MHLLYAKVPIYRPGSPGTVGRTVPAVSLQLVKTERDGERERERELQTSGMR